MARRALKTFLVLALTLVVAVGGYVGYVAVRSAQPVTLPAPTGASPVGRTTAEWTDHARVDPLAPQPGMPRELSVWLWYPASLGPGAQPAPYAPGLWAGLRLGGPVGLAETGFDHVHDHAFADVPVAAGRFPVVVLEPGLGFAAPQYTAMAESLASSGFLVAGGTPTYSANLTVLNGRPWSTTEAGNPRSFDSPGTSTPPTPSTSDTPSAARPHWRPAAPTSTAPAPRIWTAHSTARSSTPDSPGRCCSSPARTPASPAPARRQSPYPEVEVQRTGS